MGSPTISVVTCAFRPGGIDILLAGMRDQVFKDFEIILVDRRYEHRKDQVAAMAKDYNLNLIHIPEHRRNGKWIGFASAWNTAIAAARGLALIFLADWMYAPPGWIEHHANAVEGKRRYVVGPYLFLALPELKLSRPFDFESIYERWKQHFHCVETHEAMWGGILDEIDVFKNGRFDASWIPSLAAGTPQTDLRLDYRSESGTGLGEGWLHIKNDSVYRDVLMKINGLDERLERGRGPLDIDLQLRLGAVNVELWWDIDAAVYYVDPHVLIPTLPYGSINERLENRWCWVDGLSYVTRRRAEIDFGGLPRAKNNYDIEDLAARMEEWRDNPEARITRDVSDEEYWKKEVWPDSL
ncbi:MAG: glycosyltransferase family A protein [Pseudomonadota bacterium]|nr:glycosyltransferase family A protein [Pseudomonadota bacterium]